MRNKTKILTLTITVLGAMLANSTDSGPSTAAVRIDPSQYTIYISKVDGSVLQIHNNCRFRIRIPIACCENKNGKASDEILPLFMVDRSSGKVLVPNLKEDIVDGHWMEPGESARFRVPGKFARAPHSIYVPFQYEWEQDGHGPHYGFGEPQHYLLWIFGPSSD
jgi:hypothetical protein